MSYGICVSCTAETVLDDFDFCPKCSAEVREIVEARVRVFDVDFVRPVYEFGGES